MYVTALSVDNDNSMAVDYLTAWLLLEKSTYPIHQKSPDVYLLDLASKKHRRLDAVCSDRAESCAHWSSNGRWFILVSNRRDEDG